MKRTVIVGVFCLCVSGSAHADLLGTDFKDKCGSTDPNLQFMDKAFCAGYTGGVIDFMRDLGNAESPRRGPFCDPAGARAEQYQAVIDKYLADHPEKLNLRASDLIFTALSTAFPCSK